MDLELNGKVALVTAASRGLGRAIAEVLSEEGTTVAISGRQHAALQDAAKEIQSRTGANVLPVVADATCREDVERLVDLVEQELGPIDILVNNSGAPETANFLDISDEQWRSGLEIKLMAQIRHARSVLQRMTAHSRGSIVNIVGTHALLPHAYAVTAGVANAALLNLSKALAEQGAAHGIRVNAVNPGPIETERMTYLAEEKARDLGIKIEAAHALLTDEVLMKRFGTPREIAAAVAFLASPRASYITGAFLNVDGGMVKAY